MPEYCESKDCRENLLDKISTKVPFKIFVAACLLAIGGIGGSYGWAEKCKSQIESKIAGKEWVKSISEDVSRMAVVQQQNSKEMAIFFKVMETYIKAKDKLDDKQSEEIEKNKTRIINIPK